MPPAGLPPLPNIPLGRYRHYKGNEYEVFAIGRIEETGEPAVIYRALYDAPDVGPNAVWVRPVSAFADMVMWDGKQTPHFCFIG